MYILNGLPLVAQTEKNLSTMQETQVPSLGWEDPLEEGVANPLQYSCLENPHGQRSHGVTNQTQLSDYQHSTFYFLYLLMPFLYFSFLLISAAVFFCLVIPFRSFRLVILTSLVPNLLFNLLNFFFTTLSTCYLHRLYHTYSQCAF